VKTRPIQSVEPFRTRTHLIARPRAATAGSPITLVVTVADLTHKASTPTGDVTFLEGETVLGSVALSAGKATLTTSSLPVGKDRIHAVYLGTANFTRSTSTVLVEHIHEPHPETLATDHVRIPIVGRVAKAQRPLQRRL
jgi:hypothetical protein